LEMARRLAEWREDEARRQNRPLRQMLRDDVLVAIAKRQPSSRRDLEALRDFNRPSLVSRSSSILAVLEAARAVPEEALPEHRERPDDSPGASTVASLLSAALAQLCVQNKVAASLVANVSDLKHLIRWYLDGRPQHARPALLLGWRGELCGRLLLEVLDGRRTFRVVDPASDFPVALESAEPTE
jgi:ribonuclease D